MWMERLGLSRERKFANVQSRVMELWMAKSAMRHQPMRGHAPGAMLAECLSCPVGEIRDLLQGS